MAERMSPRTWFAALFGAIPEETSDGPKPFKFRDPPVCPPRMHPAGEGCQKCWDIEQQHAREYSKWSNERRAAMEAEHDSGPKPD